MPIRTILILSLLLANVASASQSIDNSLKISPVGTVIRSAIIPGLGQLKNRQNLKAIFSFVTFSGLIASGFVAHKKFEDLYNNIYTPIALEFPDRNPTEIPAYNRANEQFKLRQFFLSTAIGVWAYGITDAYVGAKFYNAKVEADHLSQSMQINLLISDW